MEGPGGHVRTGLPNGTQRGADAETPAWSAGAAGRSGSEAFELAVAREERHDVLEPEPPVTTLAHAIERQLAAVTQPLHGVDVQVEHLRDFARGEHRSEIADSHRRHVGVR